MKVVRSFYLIFKLAMSLTTSLAIAQSIPCNQHLARQVKTFKTKVEYLQFLYPHLSAEQMLNKMRAVSGSFKFFRSFVADFWYQWYQSGHQSAELNPFMNEQTYSTWITGDGHVENFGIYRDQSGQLKMAVLDFDDAERGDPRGDLMRFLISTKFAIKNPLALQGFLNTYLLGLNGRAYSWPRTLLKFQKRIDNVAPGTSKISWFATDRKLNPLKFDADPETSFEQVHDVQEIIEKRFHEFSLLDFAVRKREHGGSAGLDRYLAVFRDDSVTPPRYHIVEFKQLVGSAAVEIPHQIRAENKDILSRIRTFKKHYNMGGPFEGAITVGNKIFEVRPKYYDRVLFSLEDFKKRKRLDVVEAEAYTLGTIHARGLRASEIRELSALIEKTPLNAVERALENWITNTKATYRETVAELKP